MVKRLYAGAWMDGEKGHAENLQGSREDVGADVQNHGMPGVCVGGKRGKEDFRCDLRISNNVV